MIKQSLKLIWRRKASNGLLVMEFFLTFFVLYIACILIINGVHRYLLPDGFDINNVVSISAYKSQYSSVSDEGRWTASISELQGNEGMFPHFANTLRDIATVQNIGLMGREIYNRRLVGAKATINGTPIIFSSAVLSDTCKDILNVDLIQGRWFSTQDDVGHYEPILINTMLRDETFGGGSPLGAIIDEQYRIIGVVSDLKIFGELEKPQPLVIKRTSLNNPNGSNTLIVKLSTEPTGELIATILEALQSVAPNWTFIITPANELRTARIKEEVAPYVIAGMTASLLTFMVLLGLFGVLWQNIAGRTKEIGLRRAKGANIGHIYIQIIGEMLVVSTVAIVPGIVIVIQLLFLDTLGFIPYYFHVLALAAAALMVYGMVVVCSLYPGYMATRINPAQALHYE